MFVTISICIKPQFLFPLRQPPVIWRPRFLSTRVSCILSFISFLPAIAFAWNSHCPNLWATQLAWCPHREAFPGHFISSPHLVTPALSLCFTFFQADHSRKQPVIYRVIYCLAASGSFLITDASSVLFAWYLSCAERRGACCKLSKSMKK